MKTDLALLPPGIIDTCNRYLNLKEAATIARPEYGPNYRRFIAPEKRSEPHKRYLRLIEEENAAWCDFRDACESAKIDPITISRIMRNNRMDNQA